MSGGVTRKATIEDADSMDRLNRMLLPENYPIEFWKAVINLNHSSNHVIEVDGEDGNPIIVAYILGAVEHDNQQRLKGHVYSIAVLPNHRRKGYASQLLQVFESDLKTRFGVGKITLHVRKTSKGAISFYHRNEYQRIKKVKEYYGKGNDGYLFEKLL